MLTGRTPDYQITTIENDGFWPDLQVGDFERLRGTPAAQDDERVAHAVVNAMASVNLQLDTLKTRYQRQGYPSAEAVIALPKLKDRNRLVIQYQSAVFARAKADLLPDFATVSQKKVGDHLAERSPATQNELLAESERLIRHMLGKHRASVELI